MVWSLSAGEVIADAYSLIGVKRPGAALNANLFALGVRTLNGLLQEMPLHGYAWPNLSVAESPLAWVSGHAGYVDVPADYGSDLLLSKTDASGNHIPLSAMTRTEWLATPNKDAAGSPLRYFVDVDGKAHLWPVPASDPGLLASYIQAPADVVNTSPVDVPAAGVLALVWGVAAHLAPHFQIDPAMYLQGWQAKRATLIANGVESAPIVVRLDD